MIHELKTHPEFFSMVFTGTKNFEVRKNDRDFKVGDEILLKEWIPEDYHWQLDKGMKQGFTGRILHRRIDYILKGGQFGIEDGYAILSISKL